MCDKEKIGYLKSTNNLNKRPETVKDELFQKMKFFDPNDKTQVKYELLRKYYIDEITITEVCKQFGLSRETFYTLSDKFKKFGLQSLVNEKTGRKKSHKITLEISGYIIQKRAKDETLSGAKIAKMVKEKFGIKISKKSVERELKKFGLFLKRRGYYFK